MTRRTRRSYWAFFSDLVEHPKVALALLDCVPGVPGPGSCPTRRLNGLALVVLDADRDPDARGDDASEFVAIPALHEAYAAAQEPPSPARGKAAAVGSAAAVSAIVGAAAGVLIGRRRR